MEKYIPQFSLTKKMLMYVSSVSEILGKASVSLLSGEKKHLLRGMIRRSVCASLQIGGSPVSVYDLGTIEAGQSVLILENDVLELKNALAAYRLAENADAFSIEDFKAMHAVMTCGMQKAGDGFRTDEASVNCDGISSPSQERDVRFLLEDLFAWINEEKGFLHPLVLSSVMHFELLRIRPFADGNGRTARLWQKILLMSWNPIFEFVPLECRIETFRRDYFDAGEKSIRDGRADVFVEFILARIQEAMYEFYLQIRSEGAGVSMRVRRLLGVMELDVPYTTSELMKMLGLRSRESFRRNYLRPAMALSRVKMTVPEKPRSVNQRYIRSAGSMQPSV